MSWLILYVSVLIIFACITVVFLYKSEQKTKKITRDRDLQLRQRIYELSVLKDIQDRIGYELDVAKVVDVVTGSLRNLFEFSSVSSILLKDNKVSLKFHIEEEVNHAFLDTVKQGMIASFEALASTKLPENITTEITGVVLDDTSSLIPLSFFHIPIIIKDEPVGVVTIASGKPNMYKEKEVTTLYQIVNQATTALSRLKHVLDIEKGKLVATIGSLTDGVFTVDTNQQLIVINSAAIDMLGVQNTNPTIIDVLAGFAGKYDMTKQLQLATQSKKIIEVHTIILRQKFVHMYIIPITDEATNQIIETTVLLQDITLEKNLAQLKEDFTNMMIHELRAPLTAIKGSVSLLRNGNENMSQEERGTMLGIIENQTMRMLQEISELLDAAKLESGKFTVHKQPTDLKQLINEHVFLFKGQAEAKRMYVSLHLAENLPVIPVDPIRIGQVINNLLTNSLKFTPDGGRITISAIQRNNEYVLVSINDNGVGISKEKQPFLFSKFQQGQEATTTESAAGSGLGLYIVKGIVEAHGGTVGLLSEPGRGTTISFTIPLRQVLNKPGETTITVPGPVVVSSQMVN